MTGGIQSIGDSALAQAMAPHRPPQASGRFTHGVKDMRQIDKAAQDFEGMFMTQMMQPMFKGIGVDPVFGGGHGEETMRMFLIQAYGKIAAKSGTLGIADAVKREMIRAQSMATAHAGSSNAAPGILTPTQGVSQ